MGRVGDITPLRGILTPITKQSAAKTQQRRRATAHSKGPISLAFGVIFSRRKNPRIATTQQRRRTKTQQGAATAHLKPLISLGFVKFMKEQGRSNDAAKAQIISPNVKINYPNLKQLC